MPSDWIGDSNTNQRDRLPMRRVYRPFAERNRGVSVACTFSLRIITLGEKVCWYTPVIAADRIRREGDARASRFDFEAQLGPRLGGYRNGSPLARARSACIGGAADGREGRQGREQCGHGHVRSRWNRRPGQDHVPGRRHLPLQRRSERRVQRVCQAQERCPQGEDPGPA